MAKFRLKHRGGSKQLGGCGLLFFVLFWSAITLLFDVMIGGSIIRQLGTGSYLQTTGTITHSEVESHRGDDSTTYSAELEYTYKVDEQAYTGDRYRYSGFDSSSNRGHAQRIVRDNPVGKQVTVYYKPSDPQQAVLSTEIEGMDFFLPLFMLPFNMVMLGGWYMLICSVLGKSQKPDANRIGTFRLHDDGLTRRVRVATVGPFAAAAITLFGAGFVSIFIVAFGTNMNPSIGFIKLVWYVIFGLAAAAAVYTKLSIASGSYDLVIDSVGGMVTLPRQGYGKPRTAVPLDRLVAFEIETLHSGMQVNNQYRTELNLYYIDEDNELAYARAGSSFSDIDSLEQLRDWLHQQLELDPDDLTTLKDLDRTRSSKSRANDDQQRQDDGDDDLDLSMDV